SLLDHAHRGGIVVVTGDEYLVEPEGLRGRQDLAQRPGRQAAPPRGGPDAVAYAAARPEQEVIERMAQRNCAEVGVVLNDPPVRGGHTAFRHWKRGVCLAAEPADPLGEAR